MRKSFGNRLYNLVISIRRNCSINTSGKFFSGVLILAFIAVTLGIFTFCSTSGYISTVKNVASVYNPSSSTFHPEYVLYHTSDSISNLFINVDTKELHYNSANPLNKECASIKIHYRVYAAFTDRSYFDSISVIFNIYQLPGDDSFSTVVPVSLPAGRKYSMEITTTDMLNQSVNLQYLFIDKTDVISDQNYLITSDEGRPYFRRYLSNADSVRIENNRTTSKTFFVGYRHQNISLPLPPFSVTRYKDEIINFDSIWVFKSEDSEFVKLDKEGAYFISVDSTLSSGITVFKMPPFFPNTLTPSSVLSPLNYLSTNREFRKLEEMNDKKLAVDSFWLDVSGNIVRSKELIRVYYSRIYFANKYFSSDKEGWRTDRGMIYTVFGPPKTIYISEDSERWIYGESNNLISMDFYFERKENKLCRNNFILSRQEVYKSSWYQAVDTWRNGRVYSVYK